MKIGIIGAGQIGSALIRQYLKAGHEVKMTNATNLAKMKALEDETGAKPVSLTDVVKDVDALVVTIPSIEIPKLANSLGQSISSNTVVIDTTNYYPIRDGKIDELENGMTESVWVSTKLGVPVVKAYNSILAGSLIHSGSTENSASRIALPVSGDDQHAKEIVSKLINDSGFDALDIGNLQDSWRQQPGSPVYCTDLNLSQLRNNITQVKKERLTQRREQAVQFIIENNPAKWLEWWKDCVANNRKVYETAL
ncbi:NADPH-dependent F420 reductase [Pinibacter aurantiacus]|uniref:NAD(P)-binding domain-containing protein n=1 Tax=Pinibacter aurantiacus TaxID=2851599 RepID=A0A9E2W6U5_9BACT|nr:NAD(P)-binding domain-containing protein [Pinibacter aurantiacus]MBV4360439.1 NAD(P)-binding domain-containing protein [Pinibacter aurantiacus]